MLQNINYLLKIAIAKSCCLAGQIYILYILPLPNCPIFQPQRGEGKNKYYEPSWQIDKKMKSQTKHGYAEALGKGKRKEESLGMLEVRK